ncbi:MAG: GNAT family N-acetyltransferase [Paludibacteraceae bacterium]|nr:GNAT family N-acetyltransferase [Paludibacteraceae bacterium]
MIESSFISHQSSFTLRLRKVEPSDLPFLYQWENDASAWADGSNHNPLSQKDLRDFITSSTGDLYRDGQLRLIIESNSPQDVQTAPRSNSEAFKQRSVLTLGCIDLFDMDIRNRRAGIGMYIAPEFRGKGYGAVAVKALEDYAFGFLDLRLLYAVIAVTNEPCSHLYRSLGYEPSSVLTAWTLESDAILWQKRKDS